MDLLVLSSGLGCFYSLKKNAGGAFYLRRLLRVGPVYWLFLIPWTLYRAMNYVSFRQVVGNVFFVQYLTGQGGEVNWYVTAMWLYYLLAPIFRDICVSRKRPLGHLAVIALLLLASLAFWRDRTWLIMVSRLPVFYLGMALGRMGEREEPAGAGADAVSLAAGLAMLFLVNRLDETMLWNYGLWWYPFLLIAPGACVLLSKVCLRIRETPGLKLLIRGLSVPGRASYGIFLIHLLFFEIYKVLVAQYGLADTPANQLAVLLASILCGIAFDRAGRWLSEKATGTVLRLV